MIRALAETPTAWRYGYELCQQLGLKAGAMYPILMPLADRELLKTAWETDAPAGRPPRHLYRLTGPGWPSRPSWPGRHRTGLWARLDCS